MKKILILISVLLLTGCYVETTEATPKVRYIQNYGKFEYYVDKETCVEYIEYDGSYSGNLTPRLNADGTPMLNEICLENKVGK